MKKIVLIYSGGLDSTILLYKLLGDGHDVACICFNYGQRHNIELMWAERILEELQETKGGPEFFQYKFLNVPFGPLLKGSSQTDPKVPVPEGHYADIEMRKTVVPNRNMIMISIAAAWAQSMQYTHVMYGAQNGDEAVYPDCRQEFIFALDDALRLADWHRVQLEAPFHCISKGEIVSAGHYYKAPMEKTWSCYNGGFVGPQPQHQSPNAIFEKKHCGKCGACTERKEAFKSANIPDPTLYVS